MNLFSKEKGIIFSILNAILILWIIGAVAFCVSNCTKVMIENYKYTYEEYELFYCDFEYETEEECKGYYLLEQMDLKNAKIESKRNIIVSLSNVVIVSFVLLILNKEKKHNK